jgi:hypothetical protein
MEILAFSLDFNVNIILESVFNNHSCLDFVSRCDSCVNQYLNYIHSTAGSGGPTISHSIGHHIALSSKYSGVPNYICKLVPFPTSSNASL